MSRRVFVRVLITAALTVATLGMTSACSGPYVASVKNGNCNAGRTWVPPQQGADGAWVEGHCRNN